MDNVKFCKKCGKVIVDGEKFCANCGAPVDDETTEKNTGLHMVAVLVDDSGLFAHH